MLDDALRNLTVDLDPETYVFVSLEAPAAELDAIACVDEPQGTTYVIKESTANQQGLNGTFRCRRITLAVPTDLNLVGFIARIATELASHDIACNVMAGYHHDHLFVPEHRAAHAMAVLSRLAADTDRAEP
jgi:hypothetical protein